jgi:4-hydroxybutyrate dehydrogenase
MSLIRYVTRVHFADRVLEDVLPSEMARCRIRHPLLVLDRDACEPSLADRLDGVLPSPVNTLRVDHADVVTWRRLRRQCRESRADGIIGFGGQTAMLLARAAALSTCGEGHLDPHEGPEDEEVRSSGAALPVLAIPVSLEGAACLADILVLEGENGLPRILRSQALVPKALLCDPTLLPRRDGAAMAAGAMDALARCLEAYLASAFNPPADGMALEGLRRIGASIERAVSDPVAVEARQDLLVGALNGTLAEQKGLGGSTALACGVEALTGIRRGAVHAVVLPRILSYNAPAVASRFPAAAAALGLRTSDLAEGIAALAARIGLPARLVEAGLHARFLSSAAQRAEADPASRTNPRFARAEDYRCILESAL